MKKNAKKTKKTKKRLKAIHKYIQFKIILPLVFKFHCRKPIDEKLVVFADKRDRDMPDNFISLFELCEKNGYKCVLLSGRDFAIESGTKRKQNKAKFRYNLAFMKMYAQCRAIFLVEYFDIAYVTPARPETDVIQLWHACGMIKRIAYSAQGSKWSKSTLSPEAMKRYPMHHTYTLVCGASPRLCKYYADAFRVKPEITQPLGCPRTDIYYDEKFKANALKKLHKLIPETAEKKVIVYAPTFRGNSIARSYNDAKFNYRKMKEKLSDKYVFLTKYHPLLAKGGLSQAEEIQGKGFVFDVSKELTPEEAVCVADVLISDYSSILYDYLLLERPIISYIYDIDKYVADRGIVDPYDELTPGPYVFDEKELLKALETVDEWFDIERTRYFRQEFMSACDGHSTEKIYNYVFGKDKNKI